MQQSKIPSVSGSYTLSLQLGTPATLTIGRLGVFTLSPGVYCYFGSAFGPGGLHARLQRHLNSTSRPHWHIDHLRRVSNVLSVHWLPQPPNDMDTLFPPMECRWSQAASKISAVRYPITGFGSSDCHSGCTAHMVLLAKNNLFPSPDILTDFLLEQIPSGGKLHSLRMR